MCVWAKCRMMGCGKSRQRSPEESETDVKSNAKNSFNSGGSSNNKSSAVQHGKKKKLSSLENKKKSPEKAVEKEDKSTAFKKFTSGRASRLRQDRNDEIGAPQGGSSPGHQAVEGPADWALGADKLNGAAHGKPYTLEIPNETSRVENQTKTTCKDFKTLTASKSVHVTSSQIEFFKMLDEKIEQGGECLTSGDASEVSSMDDFYRH